MNETGTIQDGHEQIYAMCRVYGLKVTIDAIEKKMIEMALLANGGVKSKAAKDLNVQRPTLVEMCRRYGLHLNQKSGGNRK